MSRVALHRRRAFSYTTMTLLSHLRNVNSTELSTVWIQISVIVFLNVLNSYFFWPRIQSSFTLIWPLHLFILLKPFLCSWYHPLWKFRPVDLQNVLHSGFLCVVRIWLWSNVSNNFYCVPPVASDQGVREVQLSHYWPCQEWWGTDKGETNRTLRCKGCVVMHK